MTRVAFALPLLLVACSGAPENKVDPATEQTQLDAPVRDVETLPPDETAVVDAGNGTAVVVPASTKIPEGLHGRWGMVPNDCDPSRADAKGLITISADRLEFYESRALVDKVVRADPDRFEGVFGFSGEGQTWTRSVTLARAGDTLTRTDEEGRSTYRRCA